LSGTSTLQQVLSRKCFTRSSTLSPTITLPQRNNLITLIALPLATLLSYYCCIMWGLPLQLCNTSSSRICYTSSSTLSKTITPRRIKLATPTALLLANLLSLCFFSYCCVKWDLPLTVWLALTHECYNNVLVYFAGPKKIISIKAVVEIIMNVKLLWRRKILEITESWLLINQKENEKTHKKQYPL
jgi:hypothetical protein